MSTYGIQQSSCQVMSTHNNGHKCEESDDKHDMNDVVYFSFYSIFTYNPVLTLFEYGT